MSQCASYCTLPLGHPGEHHRELTLTPLAVLALRVWLEEGGTMKRKGINWVNRATNLGLFTDELEVDADERVSVAEDGTGAWVRAWVWVPAPDETQAQRQAVKDSLRGMEGQ